MLLRILADIKRDGLRSITAAKTTRPRGFGEHPQTLLEVTFSAPLLASPLQVLELAKEALGWDEP